MRAAILGDFLILLVLATAAHGQQTPDLQGEASDGPRLIEFAIDDDRVAEQVAAFEEAIRTGDGDQAVFLGQRFLETAEDAETDADGFELRHMVAAPGEASLRLDSRYLIARRLSSGPPEVLARYRAIVEDRAREARLNLSAIGPQAELAIGRRFPQSRTGIESRENVAHAALESGNFTLAARLFGDLMDLDWRAPESRQSARRAGLLLALAGAGESSGFDADLGEGSTLIAGREVMLEDLATELRRASSSRAPALFGNERVETLVEVWNRPLPGWEIEGGEVLLPQPRLHGDRLIHHDRGGVEAVAIETGALIWERPFGGEDGRDLPEMDDPDLLSLGGALCGDRYIYVHAAIDPERNQNRRRTLVALDVADGHELWRFDPASLSGSLTGLILDPDPLCDGRLVWVTAFDDRPTPRCHVLALDAESGRLLGATRLPPGVPLLRSDLRATPRAARHWLRAAPLRLLRGFVIVCDQLGHVAALEACSLEPRFLSSYDRIRGEDALHSTEQDASDFHQGRILAAGDRFLVAPSDADRILAFFLRPPADARRRAENSLCQRATSYRRDGLTRLISFDGFCLVAAGRDLGENLDVIKRLRIFVDAPTGSSWSEPLDSAPLGEGILHQKAVYLCTHKYVYGTDLSDGAVFGPLVSREADGEERLGNLIAAESSLIVASRRGLRAYRPAP